MALAVRQDGAASIESAYPRMLGELKRWFGARGVPADESSDLAQETILRTLVHLKRHGQRRAEIGPLVYRIARNLLIERIRRAPPSIVPLTDDVDVADDAPDPLDRVVALEDSEAVARAVTALTPRHRRVVGLSMAGLTPAQIARELGIKRNAADALLHRARRNIAAKLDGRASLSGFVLVFVRLRSAARRLASRLIAVDPTASFAAATTGLAAVAVATVASFVGPAHVVTHDAGAHHSAVSTSTSKASVVHTAPRGPVTGATTPATITQPKQPSVSADVRNHSASANPGVSNPSSGDPIGLDLWQSRQPGNRGTTGPLLDQTSQTACDTTRAC